MMLGEGLGTGNSSRFRSAHLIWLRIKHSFFFSIICSIRFVNSLLEQPEVSVVGAGRGPAGSIIHKLFVNAQRVRESSGSLCRHFWFNQNEAMSYHMVPVYFVCISACIVINVLEVFSVMFNMILAITEPCKTKEEWVSWDVKQLKPAG